MSGRLYCLASTESKSCRSSVTSASAISVFTRLSDKSVKLVLQTTLPVLPAITRQPGFLWFVVSASSLIMMSSHWCVPPSRSRKTRSGCVRVVAQHHQLVAAAERHTGGRVKVPARIAAGVVGLVLLLVNLQQDVAPRSRQGKVREGVGRLRLQPAAAEGQVVLVLEGDLRVAECLVHLKLLTLGHSARVVAVLAAHMPEERLSDAETVALPRADFDFTKEVVALCTVVA